MGPETTRNNEEGLRSPERPLSGKTVVITGTSRGIGARAAVEFAKAGADIVGTHSNPHPKRIEMQRMVMEECIEANPNGSFETVLADITNAEDRLYFLESAVGGLPDARRGVDVLVLNAAGGLERDKDENYANAINFEANMALVDVFTPHMNDGSLIIFTQSMWGHLYGVIDQEPDYEPVAKSKHMAEEELKRRIPELEARGIKVGILVGDVVTGTAMYNIVKRRDAIHWSKELDGGIKGSIRAEGDRNLLHNLEFHDKAEFVMIGTMGSFMNGVTIFSSGEYSPASYLAALILMRTYDFAQAKTNKNHRFSILPGYQIDRAAILKFRTKFKKIVKDLGTEN